MSIQPFYFLQFTEEEENALEVVRQTGETIAALFVEVLKLLNDAEGEEKKKAEADFKYLQEQRAKGTAIEYAIYKAAEKRYIEKEATEQEILADAQKVLDSIDRNEYAVNVQMTTKYAKATLTFFDKLKDETEKEAEAERADNAKKILREEAEESYEGYLMYLFRAVSLQLLAFNYNEAEHLKGKRDSYSQSKNKLLKLMEEKAAEAYPGEQPEEAPKIFSNLITRQQAAEMLYNSSLESIDYPIDKVNNEVFKMLQEAENGQLRFDIDTVMTDRKNKEPLVTYGVDFTGLEPGISKKLSNYDKRIMVAAAALVNNNEPVTTVSRIYRAMGGKGRPSTADIQKIIHSLDKMNAAKLYLDTTAENEKYPNYERFVYEGSYVPMERITGYQKNGKDIDYAIHFFREPPLVSFARQRKQITTISRNLLEAPINKTEINLAIEDYLIVRISQMKHPDSKVSRKMLYATIFEKNHITNKLQKSRAKSVIARYLDYYKEIGFIKDYTQSPEGVTIKL